MDIQPKDVQHLEALEQVLSIEGSREIYLLGLWLNTFGLKLTVKETSKSCITI